MAKIPKNLSDKDMVKGYIEEETLADQFQKAEALDKERRRREKEEVQPALSIAYLTPDIVARLGRELMALKLQLAQEGVPQFQMKIRRDGYNITLSPVLPKH